MRWWTSGPAALALWLLCGLPAVQAQTAPTAPTAQTAPTAPTAETALAQTAYAMRPDAHAAARLTPAAAWLQVQASAAMQTLAGQVLGLADHGGRPFAIVDKQAALLAVYHADGTLAAVTRALLGRDIGDQLVPGVGERAQTGRLRPGDATTPAGRFVSSPGQNRSGEAVVWVDFAAAFAIHRLRPGADQPARARRLASLNPRDKRVSAGCVVVPAAFFLDVVQPVLGRRQTTVYVMPERRQAVADWQHHWQALAQRQADVLPVPLSRAEAGGMPGLSGLSGLSGLPGLSGPAWPSGQAQETPRPAV